MKTPFIGSMESIVVQLSNKPAIKRIRATKGKLVGIAIIAAVSLFAAGCNGNNSTSENKKKTDTVFVQQNNREREGEGMGGNHGASYGNKGDDSMHSRMGHGARGMDSMHRGRHN